MAADHTAFVDQYIIELRDLTFNSKPIINTLTMLASENKAAGSGIADALERHIKLCPPQLKLPALYLLDSIVKNVGLPYTALFARDIPEIYMAVWNASPQSRPSLQRLLGTWQKLFPQDVLQRIGQLLAAQVDPAPGTRQPDVQRNRMYQHYHQPTYSQSVTTRPQSYSMAQQQFPAQQHMLPPPHSAVLPPPPGIVPPGHAIGQGLPAAPISPLRNSYAAAYTPTYPGPQVAVATGIEAASPQRGQPSSSSPGGQTLVGSNALPAFLSQLVSAGLIPPASTSAAPVALGNADVSASRSFVDVHSKELAARALHKLLEGTDKSRPRFLDLRLAKKRKTASDTKSSRQWYVKEKDWLAGTTASAEAVPAFFDDAEQVNSKDEDNEEEASVPADPEQPTCALSGEKFDSFWDDARNEWRYQGAVALTAEQAQRHGLTEGQLVKISCLGPAFDPAPDNVPDVLDSEIKEEPAVKGESEESGNAVKEEPVEGERGNVLKHTGDELTALQSKRIKTS